MNENETPDGFDRYTEADAVEPALACCEMCADTNRMVKDMYAGFSAMAAVLPAMLNNPMLKAMSRQFGIDVDAISAQAKG